MTKLGAISLSSNSVTTSSVPLGQKGLVHIWGQNNTTVEQKLRIEWIIRDPDGLLGEQYSDWSNNIKSGDDHEFIGGRFEFFKEGIYTIDVNLLMNKDNPIVVDRYEGILCIVGVVEPPPPPPPPPEKEFPWLSAVLIGGGVILAAMTLRRQKPNK